MFKSPILDFQTKLEHFDVVKSCRIVQVVFTNYSTISISFVKYVTFPCYGKFWFNYLVYKCLSILELKGWQSPPSSRKFLKLNAGLESLDFPGICSFLQSSSDLETLVIETLVIDWDDDRPRVNFC
ncbi:hypothetical protein A4A49_12574 [Nicotiana attenuata]|uniref:FBD domain-containing protein n=1 Tax=Nicotiana attenuata TaxID=49451 RepID=A0A1J6HXD6_NICAT|nr:hypothetical protein A4A49_12574 [Nicotiana attenuata]